MNLKQILLTRNSIKVLSKSASSSSRYCHRNAAAATIVPPPCAFHSNSIRYQNRTIIQPKPFSFHIHTSGVVESNQQKSSDIDDGPMDEFLSRFVWIMRGKLSQVYTDCDKQTIDGMLLIIVSKVVSEMEKGGIGHMLSSESAAAPQSSQDDFSEDLWKTVWEVSNMVLEDMSKARKKEKMKDFLQSEEVKDMYRFAGEVGVRGDMLRELRFKWAREKMEETEFYESLQHMRDEDKAIDEQQRAEDDQENNMVTVVEGGEQGEEEQQQQMIRLPKRHGKIKYKIYGLDLSDDKWAEIAEKIHESGEVIWPQEAKAVTGKCKLVTEKLVSLKEEDDPIPVLAEWKELLNPSRIDWICLLDKLKQKSSTLYFKVAEIILNEESFQTCIRDYSKLIDSYAKEKRLDDAERVLKKMNENGVVPDILIHSALVQMYSNCGNLDRTKEAFENLRIQGFQPDIKVYTSMIISYVNAGEPKLAEALIREMEARGMKPTREMYMALIRSYAQYGQTDGAGRISTHMQFEGFQPDAEVYTLLVEAWAKARNSDQARNQFDSMIKAGYKPDDRCVASMISAYEKDNWLDKALDLLLQLEKDGFELGLATYAALIDWFGKLLLVEEAEQLLSKISELGEAPPFKVHVSLCDMYSRAGVEKKTLQTLGILETKKEKLGAEEFERVTRGLIAGGFVEDARRMLGLMEVQGFVASEQIKMSLSSAGLSVARVSKQGSFQRGLSDGPKKTSVRFNKHQ